MPAGFIVIAVFWAVIIIFIVVFSVVSAVKRASRAPQTGARQTDSDARRVLGALRNAGKGNQTKEKPFREHAQSLHFSPDHEEFCTVEHAPDEGEAADAAVMSLEDAENILILGEILAKPKFRR